MASRAAICVVGVLLGATSVAAAECPAAVVLDGDPAVVRDAVARLVAHGVAVEATPGCRIVHVTLSRRAGQIVIAEDTGDGLTREHVVSELDTAVAVIESWTRTDLDASIFAFHVAPAPRAESVVQKAPPVQEPAPAEPPTTGVEAFSAFETSVADDRTGWIGVVVGACIQVGTICAGVRGRFSTVVLGPQIWAERERHAEDLLFGVDVPRRLGATRLSFGVGAGGGATHTGVEEPEGMRGSETFGLRADAHLAWLVPLSRRIALDLSASLDLAQVTDVEASSSMPLGAEPRLLARIGAGLHVSAR